MTECQRHEGRPPIEGKQLCQVCADKAWKAHAEIPIFARRLDSHAMPVSDPDAPVIARSKVSGSPALVNLDVASLLDPRTTWDGEPKSPRYWRRAMRDWDDTISDNLGLTRKGGALVAWWDLALGLPIIGELVGEVFGLHAQLKAACGGWSRTVGAPLRIGRCDCGGHLVVTQGTMIPHCLTCTRQAVSLPVERVAEKLGVTAAAIRRRVERGQLRLMASGEVDLQSLLAWRDGRSA